MNAPPVVRKHVEHAQDEDEETGRPLGLEPDGNHTACTQPDDRHEYSSKAPLSLNNESQEEEDEQNATGEEEVFLSVVLADGWKTGKRCSTGDHRVTEYHEQSTNNAQVAQEEIEVENEAVTETLNNDNAEQSADSKFTVFLRNNGARPGKHSDDIEEQEHV